MAAAPKKRATSSTEKAAAAGSNSTQLRYDAEREENMGAVAVEVKVYNFQVRAMQDCIS